MLEREHEVCPGGPDALSAATPNAFAVAFKA